MRVVLLSVLLSACSSSDPPPSCQQALTHYYDAGCIYFDSTTSPPTTIPQGQMLAFCQGAAIDAPKSCQDELDAWLVCNNEVPSPASANADCDCTQEYMALLRCD